MKSKVNKDSPAFKGFNIAGPGTVRVVVSYEFVFKTETTSDRRGEYKIF